ncbi:uncharacterized protein EV420DRAFT_186624 [Desarmillaria tabescens]|uniref:Gelsolin-like domain-containing protein n=1 Tax=Armillaria tabescens TaxID=1929756 RepID=A0AA39N8X0_ARMTA|nr:uncharacterized protein EV420DRAFT_186624 [Desarmillaria tabescens]KAK0461206.1 hypothetical protein EV420DRAFT_186624 [Desarmillaria tabescens]
MTSTSNISRFRSGDMPKPEDGLAEWASKIKAMQQQVDADEEAEQRKLEQEIAASRLARQRRSRGTGYGSRHNSTDLAKNQDCITSLKDNTPSDVDDAKSITERQQGQVAALRKLTGGGTSPIHQEPVHSASSSKQSFPSSGHRAEPVSLAAFMGGRATGPRLNKHAPQQDAHDPAQFEQRTKIDAPHPVFGSGGVAMPGMVHGGKSSQRAVAPSDTRARRPSTPSAASYVNERERSISPQKTGGRDRTISTPSRPANAVKYQVEHPQERERSVSPQKSAMRTQERERSVSPQKTGSRDRTTSTSSRSTNNVKFQVEKMQERERPVSPQKTGSRDRTMSTPSGPSHVARARASLSSISSAPSSSAPMPQKSSSTPSQIPTSPPPRPYSTGRLSTPSSPSARAVSVAVPSLARPIQPAPRSSLGPQIPTSSSPSPAFLKAPAPKDPTPSISRLQGRGFVQNMVKASQHLEGPSSPPPLEAHRTGSGRKASVLDRWQPENIRATSPSTSPQAPPMRKARTVGPTETTTGGSESKELRSVPSLPSLRTSAASPSRVDLSRKGTPGLGTPGVGSATTMMIFQPSSTDDKSVPFPTVDELGVHRTGSKEVPVLSSKPLVHPTKERAKKPRKAKSSEPRVLVEEPSSLTEVPSSANSAVAATSASPWPIDKSGLDVPGPSPETKGHPLSLTERFTNGSRVTDRWTSDAVIGVKAASRTPSTPEPVKRMVGRKALPGLTPTEVSIDVNPSLPSPCSPNEDMTRLGPALTTVPIPSLSPSSPNSPGPSRHSRIPVSGNRPTVMDVAQAFSESTSVARSETPVSPLPAEIYERSSSSPHSRLGPQPISPVEKRKSSYERYSAIAMPPLKEEATPVSSPAGTLSRGVVEEVVGLEGRLDAHVNNEDKSRQSDMPDDIVQLHYTDEPLPHVDIGRMVAKSPPTRQDGSVNTISVDVLIISGGSATTITQDINVFYDTEVLAVVHRSKSKSSGLASTTVWAWQGKASQLKEKEEQKLKELAARYGSHYIVVPQYAEPTELLRVLENQLAIRQGSRTHWTAENTTMHVVRQNGDGIIIDELDLSIRNLCSGFSYCVSVLETIYVWHGCGSLARERQAAMQYANTLGLNVVELSNGEGDDDDMFWMILGEDDYAQADYWKWRSSASHIDPRIWHVNATRGEDAVTRISFFTQQSSKTSVFVVDCVWELFVLVGQDARTQRQNIRLAISVAQSLAKLVADDRPYQPTVHVLILPSQIPLDLRLHFRDLDEARFNENNIPDHMNLLSVDEALEHLQTKSWQKVALSNTTMLPLGIDSSLLS